MLGSWATSAPSLADPDDAVLLHSPGFDDDDPSSYLLYPPGFGPVDYSLALPPPSSGRQPPALLLPGHTGGLPGYPSGFGREGGDLGLDASTGAEVELGEVSGGAQLRGLSDDAPLSEGHFCLAGTSDCDGILVFSCVPHCGGVGSGVDEYMVAGNSVEERDVVAGVGISIDADVGVSGCSLTGMPTELATGRQDGIAACEAPVVATEIKVEGEEISSRFSGLSNCETGDSSSFPSPPTLPIGEKSSEEDDDRDYQGDDGNGDERGGGRGETMDEIADFEDGEIHALDSEVAAIGTGDEVSGIRGPVGSKNELQALPPVPSREATPELHLHMLPVGVISSIIGNEVIVEGLQKHNPLDKGSILWITETRTPLGQVDEILGFVKNPCYVVRYKSEDVPVGISEGAAVSFVIFHDLEQCKEGYDASDDNDDVISDDVKFSDDEKEAEHKRSLWQPKRGTGTRRQRNQESLEKKSFPFHKKRAQFDTSGLQQDAQSLVPYAAASVSQPPHIQGHLQALRWPPHFPRQMQALPQAPCVRSGLQAPPRHPCVPGQLQVLAPSPLHWAPGEYQAPCLADNNNGGNFPCFLGAGQVCLGGPPVVPAVPCGGQPGGPFGVEQQNLSMQEPNAAWAHGLPPQFNMGLSIMLPVNGMPCQQPQGLHAFHQHHNQAFQHFTHGMLVQHPCSPNQGMPHSISWQGGMPNPSVPLRCLGSAGHGSFSQVPSGHTNASEEGVFGLPNGKQNLAQLRPAVGQGDMRPPVKFDSHNFSVSGRPPYGGGGRYPFGRNRCPRTGS